MPISRRNFLKSTGALAALPLVPFSLTLPRSAFAVDDGYKALVAVFLFGGNDSFNMVLPASGSHYDDYRAARPNIGVDQSEMLPTGLTSDNGVPLAMHPSMPGVAQMMQAGKATSVINVGTLLEPTDVNNLSDVRKPPNLGAHNKQQYAWQHSWETSAYHPYGWAGMMMDLLQTPGLQISESMSLSNNSLLAGASATDLRLSSDGIRTMTALGDSGTVNNNFRELVAAPYGSDFSREYMSRLQEILDFQDTLDVILDKYPEDESISTAGPGAQLRMVKRAIQSSTDLGHQRQVFIVGMGGFDTHRNQSGSHSGLLDKLDEALSTFNTALEAEGLSDKVVTFTMSDFGRTIRNNSNNGTDHGWGSNQLVFGGPTAGGKAHGHFPQFVEYGENASGNKFIPGHSHEQMAATLCKWFGLDDIGVDSIFPTLKPSNSSPFPSRYLNFLNGLQSDPVLLTPVSVQATVQKADNPAEYAVDGNPDTRWSGKGTGVLFTIELNSIYQLSEIKLSQGKGDVRQYMFTLQHSTDGTNYQSISDVVTSGTTTGLESYALGNVSAKYLRIICNGNNDPANASLRGWNNFSEIQVFGNS